MLSCSMEASCVFEVCEVANENKMKVGRHLLLKGQTIGRSVPSRSGERVCKNEGRFPQDHVEMTPSHRVPTAGKSEKVGQKEA